MARFKFDYRQLGKAKRPLVPVILKHEGEAVETLALIDSGADFNVFPMGLADTLGLDLKGTRKVEFKGIGNKALKLTGNMVILTLMFPYKGKSFDFQAPVIFTQELPDNGFALLGEVGFFDKIEAVTFQYKKGKIFVDTNS